MLQPPLFSPRIASFSHTALRSREFHAFLGPFSYIQFSYTLFSHERKVLANYTHNPPEFSPSGVLALRTCSCKKKIFLCSRKLNCSRPNIFFGTFLFCPFLQIREFSVFSFKISVHENLNILANKSAYFLFLYLSFICKLNNLYCIISCFIIPIKFYLNFFFFKPYRKCLFYPNSTSMLSTYRAKTT